MNLNRLLNRLFLVMGLNSLPLQWCCVGMCCIVRSVRDICQCRATQTLIDGHREVHILAVSGSFTRQLWPVRTHIAYL